ncbi:DEAD/DEAH box helicase [Corynebacterium uberis]|uniref:DEAD/DEAH box helicase n=1 Tax=Corynebacterium TaxID=1716 RepID=UPI001D0B3DC4|nr:MULTISPECIES: DEAD/DEAH box helicase [Corynebacterium]MCZ9308693.1 DEAD/DEAH box helicase [Corynebacterium sp. c6VSa_13]UDL74332.1 DEAD/DEAH box helicase [Corynebacterium uberis]UDL76835.1 DEAD/DEAH box helicase [Corynebacterium uberis]UDL79048.1 DEAD/DEAH box helicase [Corynebacterium uberis]UDL79286.1 DEAD/DEAH box helicase [Corynebacterium uberis]
MTTFADLGLPDALVRELTHAHITEPFPIQAAAIPDALAGRDVLGRGPTGSGKTFTFGLPMLARLAGAPSRPAHPRGLILAPTRELASQTKQRLERPAAAVGLRVLDVVGGVNIKRHITALARTVDVLVATPGRAQDLINQRKLFLDDVQITAVDEADQMADMGFLPQVRKLLDLTPRDGQRLLFSATLDKEVDKLVARYLHNPVTHSTAPVGASVETMTHYQLRVAGKPERAEVVARIAARSGRTILFVRTKHGVDRQVKKLRRLGINAAGLHGDKGQGARERALAGFSDGTVPVLVATDIAARGIDVGDVSLVVHVDPPAEHKAYLHRAGRTARAGESGVVITLVTDDQVDDVAALLRKAGVTAKQVAVTPTSPVLAQLTGAREPQGQPLPPFGAPPAKKQGGDRKPAATRNRASAGGRGRTRRARATGGASARGKTRRTRGRG